MTAGNLAAQMADPRVASTADCWVENLAASSVVQMAAYLVAHLAGQKAV